MSYTGGSISQQAQINSAQQNLSTINNSLTTVQELAASKVSQTVYNEKITLLDETNTTQDNRLTAIELTNTTHDGRLTVVEGVASSKVDQTVYNDKITLLDETNTTQDTRLTDIESVNSGQDGRLTVVEGVVSSKVAQTEYDTAIERIDAKDIAQDIRLTTVEGKVTSIETDIGVRVQNEINDKVATLIFDNLATELRNKDSELTTALASKVAAETQSAVDALQNESISTKASIDALNTLQASLNNELTNKVEVTTYTNEIAGLHSEDTFFHGKIDAIEEFVKLFLKTYNINLPPNSEPYVYSGTKQNIPLDSPTIVNQGQLVIHSVSRRTTGVVRVVVSNNDKNTSGGGQLYDSSYSVVSQGFGLGPNTKNVLIGLGGSESLAAGTYYIGSMNTFNNTFYLMATINIPVIPTTSTNVIVDQGQIVVNTITRSESGVVMLNLTNNDSYGLDGQLYTTSFSQATGSGFTIGANHQNVDIEVYNSNSLEAGTYYWGNLDSVVEVFYRYATLTIPGISSP